MELNQEVWSLYGRMLPWLALVDVLTYLALGWWAWRRRASLPAWIVRGLPSIALISIAGLGWFPSIPRAVAAWVVVTFALLARTPAVSAAVASDPTT